MSYAVTVSIGFCIEASEEDDTSFTLDTQFKLTIALEILFTPYVPRPERLTSFHGFIGQLSWLLLVLAYIKSDIERPPPSILTLNVSLIRDAKNNLAATILTVNCPKTTMT